MTLRLLSGLLVSGIALTTAASPLRILPLGDSITAGYTDNPNWTAPFNYGYRGPLYELLDSAGYDFTFVGNSPEPDFEEPLLFLPNLNINDWSFGGTRVPEIDLAALGQDNHRGYGGAQSAGISNFVNTWLAEDTPDVVLLMVGTNDRNLPGIDSLIGQITTAVPEAQVIVSQIIPFRSDASAVTTPPRNEQVRTFNTGLRDTVIPAYQQAGANITLVDQYSNFLLDPSDPLTIDDSLMASGNHPNNAGYERIAQTWFEGIQAIVPDPNGPGTEIFVSFDSVSGQSFATVDTLADGSVVSTGANGADTWNLAAFAAGIAGTGTDSISNLFFTDGGSSGAILTADYNNAVNLSGIWDVVGQANATDDYALMDGVITMNDGTDSITVSGLPESFTQRGYSVTVYISHADTRNVTFDINGITGTVEQEAGALFDGDLEGRFVTISGLSDASFTLTGDADTTFWYSLAGLTISLDLVPGDADGDGDIDDTDLGIAISNFTGPVGAAGNKTLAQGDTDGDGDIDDTDLGIAISGFTGPMTPVPEPASALLLGLGGLLVARRSGRER